MFTLKRKGKRMNRRNESQACGIESLESRVLLSTLPDLDDQIGEAITLAGKVTGAISEATDVDMYRVSVPAGQRVEVDVDHASFGGLLNSYLRVFSAAGVQLGANDNGAAPGEKLGTDSFLAYTAPVSAIVYLAVSGAGNTSYSANYGTGDRASLYTGTYSLTITIDRDDQVSEAKALSASPVSGTIDPVTDVDMYYVNVPDNRTLTVRAVGTGTSPLGSSWVRLFTMGRSLTGDTIGIQKAAGERFAAFNFATATTCYVGISGRGNKSYNAVTGLGDVAASSVGGYQLSWTLVPMDSNDQLREAASLGLMTPSPVTRNGYISDGWDVNVYSFQAFPGQQVMFDVDPTFGTVPRLLESRMRLFDSRGIQLASDVDTASDLADPWLAYTFTTGGTYYLAVSAGPNADYDPVSGGGDTITATCGYYTLTIQGGADWFSGNLPDAQIQSLARKRFVDGVIDRVDMIAILRAAGDGSVVDAAELTSFRAMVSVAGALKLKMPGYVSNLAYKIVNGNPANANYQGTSLGNLTSGSPYWRLEKLINKWFLGMDRPACTEGHSYSECAKPLFVDGPAYTDVVQRTGEYGLGDCWLMAGLGATAYRSPYIITSMFIDNGDNTWTVRFYNDGTPDYVTVDRMLADYAGAGTEMWVALAEKAYAQISEQGWTGQGGDNEYSDLVYSRQAKMLGHITGQPYDQHELWWLSSPDDLIEAIGRRDIVVGCTDLAFTISRIYPRHYYIVLDYDASTKRFKVFNPHNDSSLYGREVTLTWTEFQDSFYHWANTRGG